jgi:hypothetical protein
MALAQLTEVRPQDETKALTVAGCGRAGPLCGCLQAEASMNPRGSCLVAACRPVLLLTMVHAEVLACT